MLSLERPVTSSFLESTIRGGFGHTFRKTVCISRGAECKDCDFTNTCVYQYVFETMPPPGTKIMRKYNHVPHPFVLSVAESREDQIALELKIFGTSVKYLPYFIHSFIQLGRTGLGKDRVRFVLGQAVDRVSGQILFSGGRMTSVEPSVECFDLPSENGGKNINRAVITLKTPLSIRKNGSILSSIEPAGFLITLLRRIANLAYFHCGQESDIDFPRMKALAGEIFVSNANVCPTEKERFSTRQKRQIRMGGLLGGFVLHGSLMPFYHYLKLGEITHVGHGTSFGYGRYEMEEISVAGT